MARESSRPADQRRRVQSIEVGFRVIRALQAAEEPLALRDIARAADMPPSKAHLYLSSFLPEGLVFQDSHTGRYGLGDYAIELGLSAIRQLSIVDLARPEMAALTEWSGCATYLSLFTESGPAIVSKVDGSRQGAFTVRLGYVLPLASSATGLIFLAYLPEFETEAALRDDLSRGGAADDVAAAMTATRRRATSVRADGFATTSGMINANFAAISAPVFDYSGVLVGALTLLGPDKYLVGKRLDQSIRETCAAADKISKKLGGKAGAPPDDG